MKLVRLRSAYNLNDNKFIPMSPTKIAKKSDKPLLGQLLELISSSVLNKAIGKHHADKHCHKYKIYDQLVSMMPRS